MRDGKPENYPTISPYLINDDAEGLISFAETVFGADLRLKLLRDDESIMHAELQIGDSVVMLSQSSAEWPAQPGYLHVYVPDVDVVYQLALDCGASAIMPPTQKPNDDDKRGGFIDPYGNTWWIATHMA